VGVDEYMINTHTHTGHWKILSEHDIGFPIYALLESFNYQIMNEILILTDMKKCQFSMAKMTVEQKQQIITLLIHDKWNKTVDSVSSIFSENSFLDKSLEYRKIDSQELLNHVEKISSIGDIRLKANFADSSVCKMKI
jgi:hypothetical protein